MNERYLELWAKAVDAAVPETYTSLSRGQIQKIKLAFAELIVAECAEIADAPTSQPYESYGEKIKQHFGVAE